MSLRREINDNKVRSAPDSVRNSRVSNNLEQITPKKVETQKTYTPNDYSRSSRSKIKVQSISQTIKTFAVALSTVAVGLVGTSLIIPPSITAEMSEVKAYGTHVFYSIELSDYEDGIEVVVYNDFINESQPVQDKSVYGEFYDLTPNMEYTFAIKQGNKFIYKQKVFTTEEEKDYYQPTEKEPIEQEETNEQEDITPTNDLEDEEETKQDDTGQRTSSDDTDEPVEEDYSTRN